MSTLTLIGAADRMNIHPKTLQDLIHKGKIPAAKIGRAFVLLEKDVMDYIEQQVVAQTAERRGLPARSTIRRVRSLAGCELMRGN